MKNADLSLILLLGALAALQSCANNPTAAVRLSEKEFTFDLAYTPYESQASFNGKIETVVQQIKMQYGFHSCGYRRVHENFKLFSSSKIKYTVICE